jgi:hypothetical protein
MIDLLNVSNLGSKNGGDDAIFERWNQLGFLEYVGTKDDKMLVALMFEELAYYMKNEETYKSDSRIETIAFPSLLRTIKEILSEDNKKNSKEEKVGIIKNIDLSEFVDDVGKNLDLCMRVFANIHNDGIENPKKIDLEAEATAFLSKEIGRKHLYNFNRNARDKEQFDKRYFDEELDPRDSVKLAKLARESGADSLVKIMEDDKGQHLLVDRFNISDEDYKKVFEQYKKEKYSE